MKKRCGREKLMEVISKIQPCTILMESCGTSNHWGREFNSLFAALEHFTQNYEKPSIKQRIQAVQQIWKARS